MARKKRILFICTGNSARSQMAEAFARALGGELLEVTSGGLEPKGIHPLTPKVLAEKGIDIAMQTPKTFHVADAAASDMVVTLCDNASERCPLLPARVERLHWSLDDPAAVEGDGAIEVFRRVRDEIEKHVAALVDDARAKAAEVIPASD